MADPKCGSSATQQNLGCGGKTVDLKLSDSERGFFDSIAQEHLGIIGTTVEFWTQKDRGRPYSSVGKKDPLYGEPIARVWYGPFKLTAFVEKPDGVPEVREEGYRQTFPATAWIARAALDTANASYPCEGDVLGFWDNPYWNLAGVNGDNVPGAKFYFDVIEVDEDGVLFDTGYFVGFQLMLNRRTEFTPERRITPP